MKYDSAFVPRLPDGSSIGMKLLFPASETKVSPDETKVSTEITFVSCTENFSGTSIFIAEK